MNHGPCLLTRKKRIHALETKSPKKLLRIPYLGHKTNDWVWSKINFLVRPQKSLLVTVKRRKLAWFGGVTPRQSLQNHPSGHFGGWATPWSAEEMLDGQHQRVDISYHAITAHNGLLQKRLEEGLWWIAQMSPPDDQIDQKAELNCRLSFVFTSMYTLRASCQG